MYSTLSGVYYGRDEMHIMIKFPQQRFQELHLAASIICDGVVSVPSEWTGKITFYLFIAGSIAGLYIAGTVYHK